MSRYTLTVTVPGENVFESYWYGYGVLIGVNQVDKEWFEVTVDYGTDGYRAQCQLDRFASGHECAARMSVRSSEAARTGLYFGTIICDERV